MNYPDTATFVKTASTGYQGTKTVTLQADIPCAFLQSYGIQKDSFREVEVSDAICYPKPTESFIQTYLLSLDGVYVIFEDQWFRVTGVSIHKDHLLTNTIDNIQVRLKKALAVAQVS